MGLVLRVRQMRRAFIEPDLNFQTFTNHHKSPQIIAIARLFTPEVEQRISLVLHLMRCQSRSLWCDNYRLKILQCRNLHWFCNVYLIECFQMKTHSAKKCSSSNKVLAHTKKCHLAPILYEKIFDKGLRKAKNCKINL